jgi:hypothetical protein
LSYRYLRQPVALKSSIDRNGDSRRVVGSAGAHQYADAASDEAAEKGGYRYLLETVAKCAAHCFSKLVSETNAQPAGRLAGRALGTRLGTGAPREVIRHYEDKNLFVVILMQRLLVIHAAGRIPLSATGGSSAVGVHWFPD